MRYDEFPHTVTVLHLIETETDANGNIEYDELGNPIYIEDELGNNVSDNWQPLHENFECYTATPDASERYQAAQLNHKLDRKMYYPYGPVLSPGMRVVCDGVTYEIKMDIENLGGMDEILRAYLTEVDV